MNINWNVPTVISDYDFESGNLHIMDFLPDCEDIPKEFLDLDNGWKQWYHILKTDRENIPAMTITKESVYCIAALRHLRLIAALPLCIEYKESSIAYLASLWFEEDF